MSVYISYVGNASDIVDVLNNTGFKAKLQKKAMIADQEIIVPSGLQLINTEAE